MLLCFENAALQFYIILPSNKTVINIYSSLNHQLHVVNTYHYEPKSKVSEKVYSGSNAIYSWLPGSVAVSLYKGSVEHHSCVKSKPSASTTIWTHENKIKPSRATASSIVGLEDKVIKGYDA